MFKIKKEYDTEDGIYLGLGFEIDRINLFFHGEKLLDIDWSVLLNEKGIIDIPQTEDKYFHGRIIRKKDKLMFEAVAFNFVVDTEIPFAEAEQEIKDLIIWYDTIKN